MTAIHTALSAIRDEVTAEIQTSEDNTRRLRALRQRIDLLEKEHNDVVASLRAEVAALKARLGES